MLWVLNNAFIHEWHLSNKDKYIELKLKKNNMKIVTMETSINAGKNVYNLYT